MANDPFLRSAIGIMAHVLNELVINVGLINSNTAPSEQQVWEAVAQSLNELNSLMARVVEAFPPPPENGAPGGLH